MAPGSEGEGEGALAGRSRAALAEGGTLATHIPAFAPRPSQQDLSAAVADALDARGSLLAEAGTGTGKTFAYLVPALLSGLKTIVSTGTRALQDQLYHRDLPRVRDALGVGIRTALLKGRANYLCLYRLERAKGEPRFTAREQIGQFQRIVAWAGRTRMGDMAELDGLPDDSPLLPMVTSTAENCLGSECPFWSECFVVQARQRAQSADVVVVNHHLLLADLALKQEGFGEILPGAQAFVVDEAHQLPDLAAQFFGESLSARPLVELGRDALAECKDVEGSLAVVQQPARDLEHATRALRAAMEGLPPRGTRFHALQDAGVREGLDELAQALSRLATALAPLRKAAPGFEACHVRAQDQLARVARWQVERGLDGEERGSESLSGESSWENEVRGPESDSDPLSSPPDDVRWYELSPRGFRLQRTPLDVSGPLRAHREASRAAWIFTSATLAVDGHFNHIATRLGLSKGSGLSRGSESLSARTRPDVEALSAESDSDPLERPFKSLLAPSPFDWATQALCYLPPGLPQPSARDYTAAVAAAVMPVLRASNGRAFVLFASHRALREAAAILQDGPWPLFVQGQAPRAQLLQRFRESGNGVLLGAASFREGVDVAGDALSVVVIDKLPFAAPDDPVFEARLDAIRRAGGNPFRDEQLPQAVIALKQGVGRLIRTETDRGVLVLCDPRLLGKSYGKLFLDSLPPFPKTREVADVEAFFERAGATEEAAAHPAHR